jgi:hypothetical protein
LEESHKSSRRFSGNNPAEKAKTRIFRSQFPNIRVYRIFFTGGCFLLSGADHPAKRML